MRESYEEILAEKEQLRRSLEEAQELLRAISSGEVDALVLSGSKGDQVFTIEGADRAYRVLIEAMNDGAVTMTSDGTILYCNKHFAEMVKCPLEKVIGSTFCSFIPKDDQAAFRAFQQEMSRGELTLRAKDESILPVYISVNSLQISESQEDFCVVVTDLTEQKQKEEIVAAEKLARSIIEQATEAVVVCNSRGKIIRFSNAVPGIAGYDPMLKSFDDLFDLHLPIGNKLSPVSAALHGEVIPQVETVFERVDGTLFNLLLNAGPLKGANGKIIGCVITLTDITNGKKAEKALEEANEELEVAAEELRQHNDELLIAQSALRESEEKLSSLYTSMVEGVALHEIVYDESKNPVDYVIIDVNPSYEKITGYLRDKALGQRASELYGINKPPYLDVYSRVASSGMPESFETYFSPMKKHFSISVFSPAKGKFATIFSDITDRKLAEEERRKNESRFRVLTQNLNSGVALIDEGGKFTIVNPAFLKMFGLSEDRSDIKNVNDQNWGEWQVFGEDGRQLNVDDHPVRKAAMTGKPVRNKLVGVRLPSGVDLIWMLTSAEPILKPDGRIDLLICTFYNITERKKAEETLERSNQKINEILSSIREDFYVLDRDWNFVYANNQFTSRIGKEPKDFIGKNIWKMFPKHVGTVFEDNFRAAMDKREIRRFEVGGKYTNAYYRMAVFPSAEGITVLGTDITEQKKTEEALRESEARFRSVLDNSLDVIYRLNVQTGCYEYISPSAQTVVGFSPDELRAMDLETTMTMIHPDDMPAMREAVARLEYTGTEELEYRQRTKNGDYRWISNHMSLVKDSAGRPLYRNGNIRDTTERKQMEEGLRKARDELEQKVQERTAELKGALTAAEESVRAKAAFLANMSHELRTPLNAVIGFSSLLLDDNLAPDHREYIEGIRKGGEAQLAIIDDILEFSKSEKDKIELERQPFSLKHLIDESLDMVATQASKKGLNLSHTINYGTPDTIIGDHGRLRQILVNLLGNAVKFTDKGDVSVSVSSKAIEGNQHQIFFAVKDTGIGIPQDKMNELFKPFTQVERTISRKRDGVGLGLAITKNLVELMGGTICVESTPGKGTTFSFTTQAEAVPGKQLDFGRMDSGIAPESLSELKTMRILVAEDNPSNQRMLVEMLKRLGYRADAVTDGREVVQALERQDYDLVLMDIKMPEMDGITATQVIRKLRPENVPKIVAITAFALEGDRERCLEAGMDDYIAKPVQIRELAEILKKNQPSSAGS